MPTKMLPPRASFEQLKKQAKELRDAHLAPTRPVLQRIREFHPGFRGASDDAIAAASFTLSDAQLTTAREYGFTSWARLKRHVESDRPENLRAPHHERIGDPVFRRAVDLLDAGDADGLRRYLHEHPDVVRQRVRFEGGNYFSNPSLLEFVAENPVRRGSLPQNIANVARVVLDAGADRDQVGLDSALGLVATGRVPRESGTQGALIDVLCDHGADPSRAVWSALLHGEFGAVEHLLRRGARVDVAVAAGLGRLDEVRRLVAVADDEARQRALALAAQHGHADVVRLLLEHGADPNRYSPGHSHCTPLHHAAVAGHEDAVRVLLELGADPTIEDVLFHGTPAGWAAYGGHPELAAYLAKERR